MFALVTLPVLTLLLTVFRDRVGVSSVLLMYLLAVVGTAAIGGLWPALAAARRELSAHELLLRAARSTR